ncbi:hypothetical protein JHV666_48640 [Mycobacterium avium subsp. hominissuis]
MVCSAAAPRTTVSVAAMAELMLFDAQNPRSLLYQVERLRDDPDAPGRSLRSARSRSTW